MTVPMLACLLLIGLLGGIVSGHPVSQDWGGGGPSRAAERATAQGEAPTVATPEQLAALQDILARPEFGAAAGRGWLDALLDPPRAWLRWAVEGIVRGLAWLFRGSGDAIGWGVAGVALLITALAGLAVARLARGTLATDAAVAEGGPSRPIRAEEELARARALAEAGDLRGAVHHRYLGVLRRLDERGVLRFERSLTNRELLPRVPADAAVAVPLAPLVARFDRLWYGQSTCTREEHDEFARLADRVWEATG